MELPEWMPKAGAKDSWKTAQGVATH